MARLHIICGNCGCNDMWTWKYDPTGHDVSDEETKFEPSLHLTCGNCSTLHDLDDNAQPEK
jgi:hypothetical protein